MVAKFRNPNFGKCFTIYYFKLYSELIEIAGQGELIEIAGQGYIAISSGNLTALSHFHWKYKVLSLNILELSIFGEKWHLTALILGVVPVET